MGDRRRRGRPAPVPGDHVALPGALPGPEDAVYLSFGAVQGMLAPITPLGGDAIRCVMAGGAQRLRHLARAGDEPVYRHGRRTAVDPDRPGAAQPAGQPGPARAAQGRGPERPADLPRSARRGVARATPPRGHALGGAQAGAVRSGRGPQPRARRPRPGDDPGGVRRGRRGGGAARDQGVRRDRRRTRPVPSGRRPRPDPAHDPVRRLPHCRPLRRRRHRRSRVGAARPHPFVARHRRGRPRGVAAGSGGHPRPAAQRHHRDGPRPLAGRPDGPRRPRSQPARRRPPARRARGPVCPGRAPPRGHRRAGRFPRRVRDARDRRDRPRPPAVE